MRIIAGLVETTARYEELVIIGALFIYDLGKKTKSFLLLCSVSLVLIFNFVFILLYFVLQACKYTFIMKENGCHLNSQCQGDKEPVENSTSDELAFSSGLNLISLCLSLIKNLLKLSFFEVLGFLMIIGTRLLKIKQHCNVINVSQTVSFLASLLLCYDTLIIQICWKHLLDPFTSWNMVMEL